MFDPVTKEVFEISGSGPVYSLTDRDPWQWIRADMLDAYREHAINNQCRPHQAYDDVDFHLIDGEDEVMRLVGMACPS